MCSGRSVYSKRIVSGRRIVYSKRRVWQHDGIMALSKTFVCSGKSLKSYEIVCSRMTAVGKGLHVVENE